MASAATLYNEGNFQPPVPFPVVIPSIGVFGWRDLGTSLWNIKSQRKVWLQNAHVQFLRSCKGTVSAAVPTFSSRTTMT